MNKPIKEGMKFKLGVWTWRVTQISHMEGELTAYDEDNKSVLELDLSEAHHLDWIEPEVKKLTKEQAEMIKKNAARLVIKNTTGNYMKINFSEMNDWLDSITESE